MADIEDWGVTVDEYLQNMAEGIDILEVRRLESCGIPTHLAIEAVEINKKLIQGIATPEEVVRSLMILSPSLIHKLDEVADDTSAETSSSD